MANQFYVDTRREAPNTFASFTNSYLKMRVPLAMEVLRARLAAADPSARLQMIAKINEQRAALFDAWTQAERDAMSTDATMMEVLGQALTANRGLQVAERQATASENVAERQASSAEATTFAREKGETDRLRARLTTDKELALLSSDTDLAKSVSLPKAGAEQVKQVQAATTDALARLQRGEDPVVVRMDLMEKMDAAVAVVNESIDVAGQRASTFNAMRLSGMAAGGTSAQRTAVREVLESSLPAYAATELTQPSQVDIPDPVRIGGRPIQRPTPTTGEDLGRETVGTLNALREGGVPIDGPSRTESSTTTTTKTRRPAEDFVPQEDASTGGSSLSPSTGTSPDEERTSPDEERLRQQQEQAQQSKAASRTAMQSEFQRQMADLDRQQQEQEQALRASTDWLGGIYDPLPGSVRERPRKGAQPMEASSPGAAEDFLPPDKAERQERRKRKKDRFDATGKRARGTAFTTPISDDDRKSGSVAFTTPISDDDRRSGRA